MLIAMPRLSAIFTFAVLALAVIAAFYPKRPTEERDIAEIRHRLTPHLTRDLAAHGLTFGAPVFMRIFKEERALELWLESDEGFSLFRTYDICNHSGNLGPKLQEGDRQSPEGFYEVSQDALNPNSSYHLAFNLGFPNAFDRANNRTGSFLMVHGRCASIGCYAMTDQGIEEIYVLAEAALLAGQTAFQVHAFPFRMTEPRLVKEANNQWYGFWQELKVGFDAFEATRQPPEMSVAEKRYFLKGS